VAVKLKWFINGFLVGFIVMIFLGAMLIPGTMWLMGKWPTWTLVSYFITIPTFSGVFAAWLNH
jgi:hypothetical protein